MAVRKQDAFSGLTELSVVPVEEGQVPRWSRSRQNVIIKMGPYFRGTLRSEQEKENHQLR